ncbi:hypothetical protein ACWOAH_05465 [Vagococcus vulneris]|uniref:Uncharacterized protein n=1 Tax=Vagococcus vulneris TaxID=1977869 RepID=A0A429ZZJ9_9ENTE|nr:hypothetical protein [Vagococcus vulneris]RST99478.1 hypothetical protein CBF37_03905 [Vagococcus vulneris]
MKTITKVGIGFGVAAVAGVYAAVTLSEKIVEKLEHETTRYKTKEIVNNKLNGNKKLLDIVDNLSDSELDYISNISKDMKNARKKSRELKEKINDKVTKTAK